MKFTEEFKYKILETVDLKPTDKNKYWLVCCPTCGKKEAFLYKNADAIICSRKNKCGDITPLDDLIKNNDFSTKELFEAQNETKKEKLENSVKKEVIPPDGLTFFIEGDKESFFFKQALNYLISRGISKSYIKNMGYILNPDSKFDRRVFIPFFENGVINYYIARDFINTKKRARYLNSKNDSEDIVFNIDNIYEDTCLFIFEGVFDALTLENQIGTAKLRSRLSIKQAIKVWDKAPRKIVLVPDNDSAGFYNVKKDYETLIKYKPPSLDTKIYIYEIPEEYKDLNQSGIKRIDENDLITFKNFLVKNMLKKTLS